MTSVAPASPVAGALFAELFEDDAAVRPDAPSLDDALAVHRLALDGAYRWTVGAFTVPTSRIDHLPQAGRSGGGLRAALVVDDTGGDAPAAVAALAQRGWEVQSVELFLPDGDVARHASAARALADETGAADAYLELPWAEFPTGGLGGAIASLAGTGVGLTIRCGGERDDAVPPAVLAEVVTAAAHAGVALKVRGLHHPFRHPDAAPGIVSHGFVNVVASAVVAAAGAPTGDVAEVIAEDDAAAFVVTGGTFRWNRFEADPPAIAGARRRLLRAVAVENLRDPIDDLVAMDILEGE